MPQTYSKKIPRSLSLWWSFVFSVLVVAGFATGLRAIEKLVSSSQTDSSFLGTPLAYAATVPAYQAERISQSATVLRMNPGAGLTVEAKFRNTGSATWTNIGKNFIALNVTNPTGRRSVFRHRFWPASYRPGLLKESRVVPGEVGTIRFAVQAPTEHGNYSEDFQLVAEHAAWIPGGNLHLDFVVGSPVPKWQAELQSVSPQNFSLNVGEAATIEARFKNTGSATWTNTGDAFIALNLTHPSGRTSSFRHRFWPASYRPGILKESRVASGEVGTVRFALQAPDQPGTYAESFALVVEHTAWISGGEVTVNVTVAQVLGTSASPTIRIGLFQPGDSEIIVSGTEEYTLQNTQSTTLTTRKSGQLTNLSYANGVYTAKFDGQTVTSSTPLRLIGKPTTVFTIEDYVNRPAWNSTLNDNQFRNAIELRYAPQTKRLWAINELPVEYYLRGIAEAGNENPAEYLKALLISARTYALYHLEHPTKHDEEFYTLDTTAGDQVYRGYGFEKRAPNIMEAVKATSGLAVTYDQKIVVTPYFSQSDGRTRSWEEVWGGGPYPWLQSVPDPACQGLKLLGHGVGMSAYGARSMAKNGSTAEEILTYYYQKTVLKKIYE